MYPMGYIHARNKLQCMGLTTEFRITTIMLILEKTSNELTAQASILSSFTIQVSDLRLLF